MKLTVKERFVLLSILPKEGNYATLKTLRKLQDSLSLSEDEFKEYEVTQNGASITWNKKGYEEKEMEIGEIATEMIKDSLKNLDKNKKLTPDHFTIYEKFLD